MSGAQLIVKKMCEEWKSMSVKKMCEEGKSMTLYRCVGTRFNVSGDWENVFQVYKDRFVEIDRYIVEGLNKAKQDCSQGMSSRSSLTKAYAGLITFNLEVKEIAKAYNKELGSVVYG